ncbi:MAG: tetratricopeptide repeat protein [Nitrospinae bacterium]|nr:tetratricopeptide repeat protein [Nitrospinota bacterium]
MPDYKVIITAQDEQEFLLFKGFLGNIPFKEHLDDFNLVISRETTAAATLKMIMSGHSSYVFYDLVIIAHNLDGIQFANRLAESAWEGMPQVMVYGGNATKDSKRMLEEGSAVFLESPFTNERFREGMEAIMQRLFSDEEKERKELLERLGEDINAPDFLTKLENIYLNSIRKLGHYKSHAPWSPAAYEGLGKANTGCNRFDEALQNYKKAVALDPSRVDSHKGLVSCYKRMGKALEEASEIQDLLRYYPTSSELLLRIGEAHLREGEYLEAEEYFKKAIAFHQAEDGVRLKAKSHSSLGRAYILHGDSRKDEKKYREAERESNTAKVLDPLLVSAYNNLLIVYKKLGRYKEAEILFREAVKIMPDDADGWFELFQIYLSDGEKNKAAYSLEKAVQHDPENQVIPCLAGITYMRQNMFEEAVEAFSKAVEMNSSDVRLYNYLGICYRRMKRYPLAVDSYKKALAIDPEDPVIYYNLGKAHLQADEKEQAEKAFTSALKLKPDFEEAKEALGLLTGGGRNG